MAKQGHYEEHWFDDKGMPLGGISGGKGFTISWQHGPLGAIGTPERKEPTGAFVEDVIQAVIGRIECYQATQFACDENEAALRSLRDAADHLDRRTRNRERRQVEGTHAV